MTTVNRTAEALEAPQYFTPILRANMAALMQDGGTRAKIAQQIALTFVDCENIAEFTAPHCPSPRHAAAWIESLVEHAKTLRHLAAHLEEEEARASVADQIAHETGKPFNFADWDKSIRPAYERQPASPRPSSVDEMPARLSDLDLDDQDNIGRAILTAACDHLYRSENYRLHNRTAGDCLAIDLMSALRGMDWGDLRESIQNAHLFTSDDDQPEIAIGFAASPKRRPSLYNRNPEPNNILSSVALVKYLGTKDADDAGAEILKNAADYLYNRLPEPRTFETADAGDAAAIDLIDDLRGFEDGDGDPDPEEPAQLGAKDPRNDRPSTDADTDDDYTTAEHPADCDCRHCEPEPVDAEERFEHED